jgi:hypothetical protein
VGIPSRLPANHLPDPKLTVFQSRTARRHDAVPIIRDYIMQRRWLRRLRRCGSPANEEFRRASGDYGASLVPSQSRPAVTESRKIKTCPGYKVENRNRSFPSAALASIAASRKRVEVSVVEVGAVEEMVVVVNLVEWRGKAKSK